MGIHCLTRATVCVTAAVIFVRLPEMPVSPCAAPPPAHNCLISALIPCCCPFHLLLHRQQLGEQQQQSEAAAISSTYPLMRAARLLQDWCAWGSPQPDQDHPPSPTKRRAAAAKAGSNWTTSNSRPWPCFNPSKPQQQQKQQEGVLDVGHALPKSPAEWTPEQRAAAAAAAEGWVGELARGQQLLAAALQRAEAAEMELAGLRLAGTAAGLGSGEGGGGASGSSSSRVLCLTDAGVPAASTATAGGEAGATSGSSSPRQHRQPASAAAAAAGAGPGVVCADELRRQLLATQHDLMAARAELRAAR